MECVYKISEIQYFKCSSSLFAKLDKAISKRGVLKCQLYVFITEATPVDRQFVELQRCCHRLAVITL